MVASTGIASPTLASVSQAGKEHCVTAKCAHQAFWARSALTMACATMAPVCVAWDSQVQLVRRSCAPMIAARTACATTEHASVSRALLA